MDTELTGTDTQAPFIQLLSPDGTRRQDPAWERYTRDVDLETLRGFYRDMAATRRLDDEGTALQRRLARGLGLPIREFNCTGKCHGTMTSWFNHKHRGAAITVEFGYSPGRAYLRGRATDGTLRAVLGSRF